MSQKQFVIGSIAGLLLAALAVKLAWDIRWLCDDIFITFRYIGNWSNGLGLVYNAGERVQGYTHPLWLALLAVCNGLGFELSRSAMTLGIASFGATCLLLAYASMRWSSDWTTVVPVAGILLVLNTDAKIWASGGLETSFFSLLCTASLICVVLFKSGTVRSLLISGLLCAFATLTRPDGLLLFLPILFFLLLRADADGLDTRTSLLRLIYFLLPALVLLIPYGLWSWSYYGDILPNTFYAKSGGGAKFGQGWIYVSTFVAAYPSTVLAGIIPFAVWWGTRKSEGGRTMIRRTMRDERLAFCLLGASSVLVYGSLFVVRVGGDFMFARFLIPILPLIYLCIEASLRSMISGRGPLFVSLICLPLVVGVVDGGRRTKLFAAADGSQTGTVRISGIGDEHAYWTQPMDSAGTTLLAVTEDVGTALRRYFDGLNVAIVIRGQAALAFRANPSLVIENWGLTDRTIASLQPEPGLRIGHEKYAPMEYLLARHVNFFFYIGSFRPADTSFYRRAWFRLPHGWGKTEMYTYNAALMSELKRRFPNDVAFVDFEQYLDAYIKSADKKNTDDLQRDLTDFRLFYFYHNQDVVREEALNALLQKKMREAR